MQRRGFQLDDDLSDDGDVTEIVVTRHSTTSHADRASTGSAAALQARLRALQEGAVRSTSGGPKATTPAAAAAASSSGIAAPLHRQAPPERSVSSPARERPPQVQPNPAVSRPLPPASAAAPPQQAPALAPAVVPAPQSVVQPQFQAPAPVQPNPVAVEMLRPEFQPEPQVPAAAPAASSGRFGAPVTLGELKDRGVRPTDGFGRVIDTQQLQENQAQAFQNNSRSARSASQRGRVNSQHNPTQHETLMTLATPQNPPLPATPADGGVTTSGWRGSGGRQRGKGARASTRTSSATGRGGRKRGEVELELGPDGLPYEPQWRTDAKGRRTVFYNGKRYTGAKGYKLAERAKQMRNEIMSSRAAGNNAAVAGGAEAARFPLAPNVQMAQLRDVSDDDVPLSVFHARTQERQARAPSAPPPAKVAPVAVAQGPVHRSAIIDLNPTASKPTTAAQQQAALQGRSALPLKSLTPRPAAVTAPLPAPVFRPAAEQINDNNKRARDEKEAAKANPVQPSKPVDASAMLFGNVMAAPQPARPPNQFFDPEFEEIDGTTSDDGSISIDTISSSEVETASHISSAVTVSVPPARDEPPVVQQQEQALIPKDAPVPETRGNNKRKLSERNLGPGASIDTTSDDDEDDDVTVSSMGSSFIAPDTQDLEEGVEYHKDLNRREKRAKKKKRKEAKRGQEGGGEKPGRLRVRHQDLAALCDSEEAVSVQSDEAVLMVQQNQTTVGDGRDGGATPPVVGATQLPDQTAESCIIIYDDGDEDTDAGSATTATSSQAPSGSNPFAAMGRASIHGQQPIINLVDSQFSPIEEHYQPPTPPLHSQQGQLGGGNAEGQQFADSHITPLSLLAPLNDHHGDEEEQPNRPALSAVSAVAGIDDDNDMSEDDDITRSTVESGVIHLKQQEEPQGQVGEISVAKSTPQGQQTTANDQAAANRQLNSSETVRNRSEKKKLMKKLRRSHHDLMARSERGLQNHQQLGHEADVARGAPQQLLPGGGAYDTMPEAGIIARNHTQQFSARFGTLPQASSSVSVDAMVARQRFFDEDDGYVAGGETYEFEGGAHYS